MEKHIQMTLLIWNDRFLCIFVSDQKQIYYFELYQKQIYYFELFDIIQNIER